LVGEGIHVLNIKKDFVEKTNEKKEKNKKEKQKFEKGERRLLGKKRWRVEEHEYERKSN
jgi:hypothetical protein